MRPPINCARHGQQRRAYVCEHIIETGNDSRPRGFVWQRDAEQEYEALCTECSQLSLKDWERLSPQRAREVCLQCFAQIGELNGINWKGGKPS